MWTDKMGKLQSFPGLTWGSVVLIILESVGSRTKINRRTGRNLNRIRANLSRYFGKCEGVMKENKGVLRLEVGASTDIGRKRRKNEDSYAVYTLDGDEDMPTRAGGLFVVADGLGGHMAGDVASKLAVKILGDYFTDTDGPKPVAQRLVYLARKINRRINSSTSQLIQDKPPMATTLTAVHVRDGTARFINVGDSRAYLVRDGTIRQITVDHTWVREQVELGLMSEQDAQHDKRRNLITRTIGTQPEVDVDVFSESLEPDDKILLCTDGLTGCVSDEAIMAQIVAADSAQEAADGLVQLANERGGRDNITAIVIWIDRPWKEAAVAAVRRTLARSWPGLVRLAVLLALIGAAFLAGYLLSR